MMTIPPLSKLVARSNIVTVGDIELLTFSHLQAITVDVRELAGLISPPVVLELLDVHGHILERIVRLQKFHPTKCRFFRDISTTSGVAADSILRQQPEWAGGVRLTRGNEVANGLLDLSEESIEISLNVLNG